MGDLTERAAAELETARRRSLTLLEPLCDDDLVRQHSPLMSPLVWDLAHVGNYEDQWLLRALGADGLGAGYDDIYDAFRHPRRDRPSLPLLGPEAARAYVAAVRAEVLDLLDRIGSRRRHGGEPLLDDLFVYGMVVQHEHQHAETMLATLQLMDGDGHLPPQAAPPGPGPVAGAEGAEVLVPGGPFMMGTDRDPWAYDNERPAHRVEVAPFFIDTTPVTNRAYLAFVEAGGYDDPRWWSTTGWAWRQEAGLVSPEFWDRDGSGGWTVRRFGRRIPLPPDEPVQHVCWYEAGAYARWAGKRLPTEAEWEKAAAWDPATGRSRPYAWGDGASPLGVHGLIGGVWEWTASSFSAYPGFRAFPYREYSEVFFGTDYKVLRGGSWATHPTAVRATFRNWDFPIRRQIFAGFRCARDAG